ncbi:DUF4875 domain-containing protein [Hahella aquimaris]|uniref:DUF4875 domain-containing protein n=1 Tax=Hahella sp. HNIBRBA332 TaxID=3015983 RepID=UPI00273B65ED|nr:DUF4875 domain-containing protein [Hahella sp. HNIBRBA332]WLQ14439.1 DUF4875 domain-containing protein [Hahella sp. HNIBRBA332]
MKRAIVFTLTAFLTTVTYAAQPSIGFSKAATYDVVSQEKISAGDYDYIFSCVTSRAVGKEERAHTMVKAIMDIQSASPPGIKIALHLAPDRSLCQEGRLIGVSYYSPDGSGWKRVGRGSWTWNISTTGKKVTEQEISDTVLYEKSKPEFKKKFGDLYYSEKLDEYVKSQLGHEPKYVTTGLWVDTYHVE